MSSEAAAAPTRHRFLVYAPDKTEENTLEKRFAVRQAHLAAVKEKISNGTVRLGGALLTPESLQSPPAQMIGSVLIYEAESIDQVWEMVKNDIYYTSGVWDPAKVVVLPYVIATPFNV